MSKLPSPLENSIKYLQAAFTKLANNNYSRIKVSDDNTPRQSPSMPFFVPHPEDPARWINKQTNYLMSQFRNLIGGGKIPGFKSPNINDPKIQTEMMKFYERMGKYQGLPDSIPKNPNDPEDKDINKTIEEMKRRENMYQKFPRTGMPKYDNE